MKSVLWRVAKCLSYIEEARCLKVNMQFSCKLKTDSCDTNCEFFLTLFCSFHPRRSQAERLKPHTSWTHTNTPYILCKSNQLVKVVGISVQSYKYV